MLTALSDLVSPKVPTSDPTPTTIDGLNDGLVRVISLTVTTSKQRDCLSDPALLTLFSVCCCMCAARNWHAYVNDKHDYADGLSA
jgi:hypothetical protein